jgi:peptidoglycan hydrolase-like protein with peptidoglycan-binding domain
MTIGDGHDLKSSRFAGDEVLEACYDNERILRRGDSGPAVEKIQRAVIFLGFPVPRVGANGIFGDETELAVRSYQEARGLKVDGIVGPDTIGSLDSEFYTGPIEQRAMPTPEPQVSKVRTPLEPDSPVRTAKPPLIDHVRAPEVPRVRAPEVHAPPVPRPEVPILATEVTPHERRRTTPVSTTSTPPTTPPVTSRPLHTDSQGRTLIAEGTWQGDRYLEVEAGKSIRFEIISLSADRLKVRIRADTGETRESILSPGVTVDVDFSRAGQESFIWKFDIETDSEKSLIDWKLYSY